MASYDDSTDCADAIALMNSCADFDGRANVKLLPAAPLDFRRIRGACALGVTAERRAASLPLSHSPTLNTIFLMHSFCLGGSAVVRAILISQIWSTRIRRKM